MLAKKSFSGVRRNTARLLLSLALLFFSGFLGAGEAVPQDSAVLVSDDAAGLLPYLSLDGKKIPFPSIAGKGNGHPTEDEERFVNGDSLPDDDEPVPSYLIPGTDVVRDDELSSSEVPLSEAEEEKRQAILSERRKNQKTYLYPRTRWQADVAGKEILRHYEEMVSNGTFDIEKDVVVINADWGVVEQRLQWIVGHLMKPRLVEGVKKPGFKVEVNRYRSSREDQKGRDKYKRIAEEELVTDVSHRLVWSLSQDANAAEFFYLNEPDRKARFELLKRPIRRFVYRQMVALKSFFWLYDGITFSMYSDNVTGWRRPIETIRRDMLFGLPIIAVNTAATLLNLYCFAKETDDSSLMVSGAVASAYIATVWAFLGRANTASATSAPRYRADTKRWEPSILWGFPVMFSHTLFTSVYVLTAGGQFAKLTLGALTANAIINVAGKYSMEMFLGTNQRGGEKFSTGGGKHSELTTNLYKTGFQSITSFLKNMDLYGRTPFFSAFYYLLGTVGVGNGVLRHIKGPNQNHRFIDWRNWKSHLREEVQYQWKLFFYAAAKFPSIEDPYHFPMRLNEGPDDEDPGAPPIPAYRQRATDTFKKMAARRWKKNKELLYHSANEPIRESAIGKRFFGPLKQEPYRCAITIGRREMTKEEQASEAVRIENGIR
jgi:hypothetical protein